MNREPPPVVDVRPREAFGRGHRAGAANIPLEELPHRTHELPPRDVAVIVFDELAERARAAAEFLASAERAVADVAVGQPWLAGGPIERGPTSARLWRPHQLLEEAVEIASREPLPNRRALDVACGTGRDAVFLALCGYEVDACDMLPDALDRCRELAARSDVRVNTIRRNVEKDGLAVQQRYGLVCCFNFLHRPLLPSVAEAVAPGGLVVYETFTTEQRARFGKPARDAHLLAPGELPTWFADWETLISREGLTGPRRWAASLVARRSEPRPPALHVAQRGQG